MSTDNHSKSQKEEEQGFPIQLKLLLAVIAAGVLFMLLKAVGVLS